MNNLANSVFRQRVTGDFTGTTDELLQWAACKWGFAPDVVRAEAAVATRWHQTPNGLLRLELPRWQSAWPAARDSTAFGLDVALSWQRSCYEGYLDALGVTTTLLTPTSYVPGDLMGCVGNLVSGGWYDPAAIDFESRVDQDAQLKSWDAPGF